MFISVNIDFIDLIYGMITDMEFYLEEDKSVES